MELKNTEESVKKKKKRDANPGVEKDERSVAMTISQDAISWHPAAAATPSTWAITGTGRDWIDSIMSVHVRNTSSWWHLPSDEVWKNIEFICYNKNLF